MRSLLTLLYKIVGLNYKQTIERTNEKKKKKKKKTQNMHERDDDFELAILTLTVPVCARTSRNLRESTKQRKMNSYKFIPHSIVYLWLSLSLCVTSNGPTTRKKNQKKTTSTTTTNKHTNTHTHINGHTAPTTTTTSTAAQHFYIGPNEQSTIWLFLSFFL